MKAAGLLLLVAAGGGFGWLRATALRRRAESLETARRLVLWLTAQLRYTAAPTGELLRHAATGEFRSFSLLGAVVEGLNTAPLPVAWRQAVETSAKANAFTKEDGDLLCQFGEGLGKTDLAGQQAHGELFAALLLERQQQATQAARDRGRVEGVLWPAGASALALLLL